MFRGWIDSVSSRRNLILLRFLTSSAIFASAWFQQRYGYRRLLQIGLVAMFFFIFIVFFAQNIVCPVCLHMLGLSRILTNDRSCWLLGTIFVAGRGECYTPRA